jgi:diguanylate cyclase (GGDEF)-like protein/PAS domain S-box-containing protein
MIAKEKKTPKLIWSNLKQKIKPQSRVLLTSLGVATCIVLIRLTGILQAWELAALDQLFRWRPAESQENRVVIIGIDEQDLRKIGKYPIPDEMMAELLQKLNAKGARLIGLDIFRDFPVEPGNAELQEVFASTPNIIGIRQFTDEKEYDFDVSPPPGLPLEQIGFNNIQIDPDGTVRKNLIYWWTSDNKAHRSFAFQLAFKYLEQKGINLKQSSNNPWELQLGKAVLRRFDPNDGAYVRAEHGGYQLLVNFYRVEGGFPTWSFSDVLENRVPPEQIRGRIVLIGNTAKSLKDFFSTSYSENLFTQPEKMAGVELHANFLSQLLNAAIDGQSLLLNFWPDPVEWIWIFAWSSIGAYLSWRWRSPYLNLAGILLLEIGLLLICYLAFLLNWWLPLIPASLTLAGSAIVITGYLAHLEEELKRSKDFLQGIINTVADPIFVKDRNHKWIVLNEAFANLLGHSIDTLINGSPEKFFPEKEADIFWEQAELVFLSGKSSENEETFTDSLGNTYFMATKRSLHKDAAGNLFLVGVLRDITERKQMEEELRRTAAELTRSNEELQTSHNRLRYIAYHDALTGLPNRKLFYERLMQSLEWAEFNQQSVALMFLDLDGFKLINDRYGHDAGDVLLKTVAQRLKNCLRGTDTVARLAGDEFTVILPAIAQTSNVAIVAEKILATVTEPILVDGTNTAKVTASIGISLYPEDSQLPDDLVKAADQGMYAAKELGKNQYKFYSSIPKTKLIEIDRIEK